MKLIPFLHHHTVNEAGVMECELNAPEAAPFGVRRVLSDNFTGIVCSAPTQILYTFQKKVFSE